MIIHLTKTFQKNYTIKKILPVALVTEKDRGQHFVLLVIIEQKFEQMGPKKCQMNHNSFDKNIPDANSKKIIQSERFCLLL